MKHAALIHGCLAALLLHSARGAETPENFDATTDSVGWKHNGFETPVINSSRRRNAGGVAGIRPNALALSPNGNGWVTSGLTPELVVLDPPREVSPTDEDAREQPNDHRGGDFLAILNGP